MAAATVTTVTATGTVTVPKERSAVIKAAAKLTWDGYVSGLNIGGTIRLAQFVNAVIGAGAIDVTGEQLNGSPTNLVLGSNAVGVAADITGSVTWVEV